MVLDNVKSIFSGLILLLILNLQNLSLYSIYSLNPSAQFDVDAMSGI
jgi:hypothetical protein